MENLEETQVILYNDIDHYAGSAESKQRILLSLNIQYN